MNAGVEIKLGPLEPETSILDLCAGGEGVIARAYPGRVIGVDQQESEINLAREKCPPDTVFLVGDATRTRFVANTFRHITVFFGLMYIKDEAAKGALFAEAARLLKAGGHLHIWAAVIPDGAAVFGLDVSVTLPGGEVIPTTYAVRRAGGGQTLAAVAEHAAVAGLAVAARENSTGWFYISFAKAVRP